MCHFCEKRKKPSMLHIQIQSLSTLASHFARSTLALVQGRISSCPSWPLLRRVDTGSRTSASALLPAF